MRIHQPLVELVAKDWLVRAVALATGIAVLIMFLVTIAGRVPCPAGLIGKRGHQQLATRAPYDGQPSFALGPMKVERVIDGDTIRLQNGITVRLIGVDAPELPRMDRRGERLSKEAGEYLRSRLSGKYVQLEYEEHDLFDRYGRFLAYVYLEDVLINAELIEQGYAYAYTRYPHEYNQQFVDLETEAKQAERGLWKPYPHVQ